MVQKCSISKVYKDDHYCAATFRYLKEFSVCFRDHCAMMLTVDKNKIKLGEPN